MAPPMNREALMNGKAKLNKKVLKRFYNYIPKLFKRRFVFVLFCIFLSAIATSAGALFIQSLVDDYIEPLVGVANPSFAGVLNLLILIAVIQLVGVIAAFISNRMTVTISQGILKQMRDDVFSHLQKLPIRYFDTHTHGEIMSYFTNDADTLRQMLSQSVPQLCSSVMTIAVVFVAMLISSPLMTVVVVVTALIIILVTAKVAMSSSKYFKGRQRALAAVNGYVEEMINGQKVIKVFCREERNKADFNVKNEELLRNDFIANRNANLLMPLLGGMGHLQFVIVGLVGGACALSGIGGLTLGTIAAFLMLSRSFTNPITQVSQQVNSVVMALAGADRIFNLMDEEPEQDGGYVTLVNVKNEGNGLAETDERTGIWAWKHPHSDGTVTYTRLTGDVRLTNVDFGYTKDNDVLHDVSLFAKPGQKIAFVGATGAGKTTITNLINRFYDIDDGKIRYDGININKIRKDDLRHSLGVVLQDVSLFTGTIMDNIRYGRLDASDEECIAAAQLANAHDFITRLPEGYNTVITGNGGSLSQGQCQLISIARAAVADPPVMILDEATSSIDTRTEAIVQRGMDALMTGRTVFVIAHRLSTVQNADAIIVLEHGRIIERGDHDSLIAQRGKYYQLYTGAFELE